MLQPIVWSCWLEHQWLLLDELLTAGRPLELTDDSRSDSPGHFGSYSLLETRIGKIIHFELVKVGSTAVII